MILVFESFLSKNSRNKRFKVKNLCNLTLLSISPALDVDNPIKDDIDTVTSDVFSAFQGAIQYTFDGAAERYENLTGPHINIFWTCQLMTDKKKTPDPIDRLYNVYKLVSDDPNAHVMGSYIESIKDFQNISLGGSRFLSVILNGRRK